MKWINRTLISTVIVLLIVAVAVLVAVLGFYTTGGKMEVGSWADWVSAGANIAMAGAALYAAWNAKDWLKSNLRNKGFDLALKFRTEYFPDLKKIRDSYLFLTNILDQNIESVENMLKNPPNFHSFSISLDNYHRNNNKNNFENESIKTITQISKKKEELKKTLSQLELYGWVLKPSFNESDLLQAFDELINKLHEYTEVGMRYFDYNHRKKEHRDTDEVKDYFEGLKKEHELIDKLLNTKINKLITVAENYFNYKSIQDPFDIK